MLGANPSILNVEEDYPPSKKGINRQMITHTPGSPRYSANKVTMETTYSLNYCGKMYSIHYLVLNRHTLLSNICNINILMSNNFVVIGNTENLHIIMSTENGTNLSKEELH